MLPPRSISRNAASACSGVALARLAATPSKASVVSAICGDDCIAWPKPSRAQQAAMPQTPPRAGSDRQASTLSTPPATMKGLRCPSRSDQCAASEAVSAKHRKYSSSTRPATAGGCCSSFMYRGTTTERMVTATRRPGRAAPRITQMARGSRSTAM